LSKARENGHGIPGIDDSMFRSGDGLSSIQPGEVDVVVMAGMGGVLMVEILSGDLMKARTFAKYVFQPRNHAEVLRCFLAQNGFAVTNEILVREGRHLCEIIVASPGEDRNLWTCMNWPAWDVRWEVPPMYASVPDPLALEYLHRKLEREKRVMRELRKAKSLDEIRLTLQAARIAYLKNLYETRQANDEF
jgi:tRNA (adenine22-N1)-methyltransferase